MNILTIINEEIQLMEDKKKDKIMDEIIYEAEELEKIIHIY